MYKLEGRHFLIVDDNEINRAFLRQVLKLEGASSDEADNGDRAIQLAKENTYDLILMDVRMPGISGLDTTDAIHTWEAEHNRFTPVFIITADTTFEQSLSPIEREKAQAWLLKPISSQALLTAIAKHILPEEPGPHEGDEDLPINLKHVLNIVSNDWHTMLQLEQLLMKQVPLRMAEAVELIENEKYQDAAEIIHGIHGSSGYCGALSLQQAAKNLESRLKDNKPFEMSLKKCKEEAEKVVDYLTEALPKLRRQTLSNY